MAWSTGGGLVQEQQLRIPGQGDRHVEASLLAAGKLQHPRVAFGRQPDEFDYLVDRPRVRVVAAVHRDRLGHGEVRVDAARLQHDANANLQVVPASAGVVAEHRDIAPVTLAVALQDLHGGGLAGTVRSEQREDLPRAMRKSTPLTARTSP